jgi:hypothetical protein
VKEMKSFRIALSLTATIWAFQSHVYAEKNSDVVFIGLNASREAVEKAYGKPTATGFLNGDKVYQYTQKGADCVYGVQVLYWNDRVANLAFDKKALNNMKPLQFTAQEKNSIMAATEAERQWTKQETEGARVFSYGWVTFYTADEVFTIELPDQEDWIVFKLIDRNGIIFAQLTTSKYVKYRNEMAGEVMEKQNLDE